MKVFPVLSPWEGGKKEAARSSCVSEPLLGVTGEHPRRAERANAEVGMRQPREAEADPGERGSRVWVPAGEPHAVNLKTTTTPQQRQHVLSVL